MHKLLALADRDDARLVTAVVLAAAVCLVVLARCGEWLAVRETAPSPLPAIEMRVVEIAPPVAPTTSTARSAPIQTRAAPTHSATQHRIPQPAPTHTPPAPHEELKQPAPPASAQAASAAESQSGSPASAAPPGEVAARVLSQPMPVLPDDLREQGYQVTAVARFKIHADGSFDVELVKPTQNPRLNQILLETLHRWRFFPAMENGRPVESDQEVRVHFSIG